MNQHVHELALDKIAPVVRSKALDGQRDSNSSNVGQEARERRGHVGILPQAVLEAIREESSTISSRYSEPPVDLGLFPDRSAYKRSSGLVERQSMVLGTGALPHFASEHPAQPTILPTTLMPNWRAVSRKVAAWEWPKETCRS